MLRDVHPNPGKVRRGRGGGTAASQRARFRAGFSAQVGFVKAALPRPAHQPVTMPLGRNQTVHTLQITEFDPQSVILTRLHRRFVNSSSW
jgi:hypothetical protein